jgi:hypothetical protein
MREGPPDFNPELNGSHEIQKKIVESLKSEEFRYIQQTESIGGNAGPNRAAVNALVNPETGEIMYVGNEGFDPKNNPEEKAVRAVFVCDYTEIMQKIQEDNLPALKSKRAHISLMVPTSSELSDKARMNLEAAIEKVNNEE